MKTVLRGGGFRGRGLKNDAFKRTGLPGFNSLPLKEVYPCSREVKGGDNKNLKREIEGSVVKINLNRGGNAPYYLKDKRKNSCWKGKNEKSGSSVMGGLGRTRSQILLFGLGVQRLFNSEEGVPRKSYAELDKLNGSKGYTEP